MARLIELLINSPSLDALNEEGYVMGADHLIANGVVIPVRCKDCKHYVPFVDPYNRAGMCNRKMLGLIAENDFCSYGERKDNG